MDRKDADSERTRGGEDDFIRRDEPAESGRPTTGDREQQRADNVTSREQSGLEPLPRDRGNGKGAEPATEPTERGPDGAD